MQGFENLLIMKTQEVTFRKLKIMLKTEVGRLFKLTYIEN